MPDPASRRLFLLACVALSVPLSAAFAVPQTDKVTGTIVVGTTKVTPKVVTAVGYKAPNGQMISVLVSDKPADRKAFLEMTKVGPSACGAATAVSSRAIESSARSASSPENGSWCAHLLR